MNFSVIIPHKNTPDLLLRCIKSIPQRDDLEVIVVDDNSDPNIVDFNSFPGIDRQYLKVELTKHGKGAGYARNVGLSMASGRWLIFADSDDYFLPDFNHVLDLALDSNADLIYFDAVQSIIVDGREVSEGCFVNDIIKKGIETSAEQIKYDIEVPWCKFVSHDLVECHNIRFDEIHCSNDTWFSVMTAFFSKQVIIIPIKAYCWYQRPGSLWRNRNEDWAIIRIGVQVRLAKFMKENNLSERYFIHCRKIYYFLDCLRQISLQRYITTSVKVAIQLKRPSYGLSMIKHLFL